MRLGECCPEDFNPWRQMPTCTHCGDDRIVSTTDNFRGHRDLQKSDLVPCPYCGEPGKHEHLARERLRIVKPSAGISEKDFSGEERVIVADWRMRGFHMMDCLRWIEGRRYRPAEDPIFLEEFRKALAKARLISGRCAA